MIVVTAPEIRDTAYKCRKMTSQYIPTTRIRKNTGKALLIVHSVITSSSRFFLSVVAS